MTAIPDEALELRSTVKRDGTLEICLETVAVPTPDDDEVLIRIEASPINPSDLGLLFGMADMTDPQFSGSADRPVVTAKIPDKVLGGLSARFDQSLPVGNEGAGIVVAAGKSDAAQALLGKTVAAVGGAMYAQYGCIKAGLCLVLHDGTTPAEGASCFVNPLTALGMTETMRLEGHTALVHTAAASNLGQMLLKLCAKDGIPLVNVVRKGEQEELLRSLGAKYVCNSSADSFMDDLTDAIAETGATLAFDATGGGTLAGQILTAMERAALRNAAEYSRYGSSTYKQVYIYGSLDRGPTTFERNFGVSWGIGGWLLTPFLQKIGLAEMHKLRLRVADEIKTTFASHYTKEVSLAGMLQKDAIFEYGRQSTGKKYLVTPQA